MSDYSRTFNKSIACIVAAALICMLDPAFGSNTEESSDFLQAKTIFQTNRAYEPRIAIAADGVIVHRHGVPFEGAVESWKQKGFAFLCGFLTLLMTGIILPVLSGSPAPPNKFVTLFVGLFFIMGGLGTGFAFDRTANICRISSPRKVP